MYRIIIKRDGANKLTGKRTYSVFNCFKDEEAAKVLDKIVSIAAVESFVDYYRKFIIIKSKKPYRAGCYINPAKVLRESGFIF